MTLPLESPPPRAILEAQDERWRWYPRARDAFGAVLDALELQPRGGWVLLPAYVGFSSREGSGIYDPIAARALTAKFYPMREELTVDVEGLDALLRQAPRPSALLLVHYFGRPDPRLTAIRALARRAQIVLIEDAAHAFFSAEVLSSCGQGADAVLYSMHKMFDVPEGGALKADAPALLARIPRGGAGQVEQAAWMRCLAEDRAAHASARMRNYSLVGCEVERLAPALRPFWDALPAGTIPQSFPVRVLNSGLRDRLYFGLKDEGFVVASLYHTLIEPLRGKEVPPPAGLSDTLLNLPVMPSLDAGEIARLGRCMAAIIRRAAGPPTRASWD